MPTTKRTTEVHPVPGGRYAIIAGGGVLPKLLADQLKTSHPVVLAVQGDADNAAFDGIEVVPVEVEDLGRIISVLKKVGATHVVPAGNIGRRPRLSRLRLDRHILASLPSLAYGLAQGDNSLLSLIVRIVERAGVRVVGAHELAHELLAAEGRLGAVKPRKSDRADIKAAVQAATELGRLDIGQAAVAIGGRVVAVEGIEGTEGLLERVTELRSHGRLSGRNGGVLAKFSKPGQELRVDMPSIGPDTVRQAKAAGLAGIVVEAGRTLVLDGPDLVQQANALGLFVFGQVAEGPA